MTTAAKFGPELAEIPLEQLEQSYRGTTPPEAVRMYLAIQHGSRMGASDGWFGPAQSRYDWNWLAARHSVPLDGAISADHFQGPASAFARLDRNHDGQITPDDLDWSDDHPWVKHGYLVNRLFRKLNVAGDGRLTRDQWLAFYDQCAAGRDFVTSNDLRDSWLAGMSASFLPGDAPTKEQLLKGFFAGEVGSFEEGPALDALAPDFALETFDGRRTIRLSSLRGDRPIVLVFGNFTCGPFRSMYPGVEEVYERFCEDAVFLAVYVREAHPTDGWSMRSNEIVGVRVAQPKTYAERRVVAGQCHARLHPSIPLLVDDIQDTTGHAYSGMPARLYVIDAQGRVTYKSGRGPYGFKTGEMEQSLVMTLLDAPR